MQVDLRKKVALVTGASAGIGRRIAVELARNGATVAINYHRNADGAEETRRRIFDEAGEVGVIVIQADVSDESEVDGLFETVEAEAGPVDILVNNAGGLGGRKPLGEMSEAEFDEIMRLNLYSVFFCAKRAMAPMKARGVGCIVNISSSAARGGGNPGIGAYAAAKAGVSTLTRSLARELAPYGITVNGVAPGVIRTAIHAETPPEVFDRIVSGIPLGRAGEPRDVTGAVLLLASEAGSYLTGEMIEVNGGLMMN